MFQLDISNFTIKDFLKYFKEAHQVLNYGQILSNINMNLEMNDNKNIKYILQNFPKTKIYNKLDNIINALTKKLNIRETSFGNLISNSDALNNIFEIYF